MKINTFIYNDREYMRIVPAKRLLNSTTIYEVVTRGAMFAVDLETKTFTVIPADATLHSLTEYNLTETKESTGKKEKLKERARKAREELREIYKQLRLGEW